MEIIIGLIVLAVVGYFVFFNKKEEPLTSAAPYKVEVVPVAAADVPVVVSTPEPVVETAPAKAPRKPRAPKAEKAPAKKAPAKATTKKPATIKAKATTKKPAAVKAKPKKA